MNQTDDRAFIRRFSGIILGLVAVTVIIIVLALSLRDEPDPGANPSQQRFTEERIAPVAAVRTGKEGQAAPAPARAEAAAAAEPTTVSEAAVDGEQVYQTVCMACHAAGVAGAPIPGSEALAQRHADKGAEGLVASVINGLNVMPPRAGRPDLTDEQIRAAVDFMLQ
jgi:cytochrome c5